jgi:hypothetical protein
MTAALSFTTLGCSAGAAPFAACAKTPVAIDSVNATATAATNPFFIESILSFDLLGIRLIRLSDQDPRVRFLSSFTPGVTSLYARSDLRCSFFSVPAPSSLRPGGLHLLFECFEVII